MALNYTIGNWTVSAGYTDSSSDTKQFTGVARLSASDYALASENPTDNVYNNTKSPDSNCHEHIRYAVSSVANIYKKFNKEIPAEQQDVTKTGRSCLVEVYGDALATNSVSGVEVRLPYTARLTIVVPNGVMITDDFVNHAVWRTLAAADGLRAVATSSGFLQKATKQLPKGDCRLS